MLVNTNILDIRKALPSPGQIAWNMGFRRWNMAEPKAKSDDSAILRKASITLERAVLRKSSKQHGYTLPELVLSLFLIGIISISLLSAMTYYFAYITRANHFSDLTVDSQNLLRSTAEELRYGAGVRQTNTIIDINAPSGGWNTSNTAFVIVIATPAKDSNREYIIDTATGSPYNNELVYYKSGNKLYRRTLANPSATGNSLTRSCPPASSSPSCPADTQLVESLDDMVFTLFDQDNAPTNDPLLARSIDINLSMLRKSLGGPLRLENSIQITLRNTF